MSVVSGIPDLIDALVDQVKPLLPDATVTDGLEPLGTAGDYLMIGIDNEDLLASTSAQSGQTLGAASTQHKRDEDGTVTLLALSWNGDSDQKLARDAVFAMAGAVSDLLRADPSLGLAEGDTYPYFAVKYGTDHRLLQNQDESGAEAALIFTLSFSTSV